MMEHSQVLVEQAHMVAQELVRVAILVRLPLEKQWLCLMVLASSLPLQWNEMWFEGLEEASRFYTERDMAGMFATLTPLHDQLNEIGESGRPPAKKSKRKKRRRKKNKGRKESNSVVVTCFPSFPFFLFFFFLFFLFLPLSFLSFSFSFSFFLFFSLNQPLRWRRSLWTTLARNSARLGSGAARIAARETKKTSPQPGTTTMPSTAAFARCCPS